ncbi:hypothetical protein [Paenibacillus graminis]|uniref:hypothetical protein n=1 Tax=Paenibacillus graminis TaxID=189425 RepID=UPI0012E02B53|nr:hypothetical protein [Paenibacillus graminis]
MYRDVAGCCGNVSGRGGMLWQCIGTRRDAVAMYRDAAGCCGNVSGRSGMLWQCIGT